MQHTPDGGPAFPQLEVAYGFSGDSVTNSASGGMSLRDYFAAKALDKAADVVCDLLDGDRPADATETPEQHADRHARAAYIMADAMLRARTAQSPADIQRAHLETFGK